MCIERLLCAPDIDNRILPTINKVCWDSRVIGEEADPQGVVCDDLPPSLVEG